MFVQFCFFSAGLGVCLDLDSFESGEALYLRFNNRQDGLLTPEQVKRQLAAGFRNEYSTCVWEFPKSYFVGGSFARSSHQELLQIEAPESSQLLHGGPSRTLKFLVRGPNDWAQPGGAFQHETLAGANSQKPTAALCSRGFSLQLSHRQTL